MQVLAGIALGLLFVVWIVTGARLMLLAQRTRALPEFLLGASLFLMAGLGYPLTELARHLPEYRVSLLASGAFCSTAGSALLLAFVALVFQPTSRLAWAAVVVGTALLSLQGVGGTVSRLTAASAAEEAASIAIWGGISLGLNCFVWGWAAFESLRSYRLLRRRLALGLVDPVVANRMFLFGMMGSVAVGCLVGDTLLLYLGGEAGRLVMIPIVTAGAGLAVSVCMILAFFPPAAYLQRIRGGATPA